MTGRDRISDSESGARSRIWVAGTISGRELRRDPVFVGLLVVLPAYFVGVWGLVLPADPILIEVAGDDGTVSVATNFVALMTALVAPVTGALVVGIAALFLVQRSRPIDGRLQAAGYRGPELLVARFGLLAAVTALVVAVTAAVALLQFTPEHLAWFVLALVLTAAIYGAIGVLAGLFLGRMAGVYLLLFVPMIDVLLVQLPLGESHWWAPYLPGHHPAALALSASFADSVAVAHALWATLVLVALAVLALVVSTRR